MTEKEVWWCDICADVLNVKCTDYSNEQEMTNHIKESHDYDTLLKFVLDSTNNPYTHDPEKEEA